MVSGMKEHFWPSFPKQTGRQVLSTLFNQVSIKAERDPVLLLQRGLRQSLFWSHRYRCFTSSDLHPDREQEWRGKWREGKVVVMRKHRFDYQMQLAVAHEVCKAQNEKKAGGWLEDPVLSPLSVGPWSSFVLSVLKPALYVILALCCSLCCSISPSN